MGGLPEPAAADGPRPRPAAPGVLLGVAFGRLGCFFAGCCYGAVAGSGLCYPPGSHAFRDHVRRGWVEGAAASSLPTIPMPLLEAAAAAAIAGVLLLRRGGVPGSATALAGLLYSAWRFFAEFGRGDHDPYWGGALTFSQGISLAVFVASAGALLRLRPLPERPPLPGRPLSRGQVAAFAGLLLAFGAGLACRVAPARPQEMSGELAWAGGCDKEQRVKAYREAKEEAGGCFADCVTDCMSDCMSSCIEDCCGCEEEEEGADPRPEAAPRAENVEARKRAFVRRPPAVREMLVAAGRARGLLGIDGTLNGRFPVALFLKGDLEGVEVPERGACRLWARLEEVSVKAGPYSAKGKGELELRVGEDLEVVIVKATLPDDVLSMLHAAAPLLAGYLRIEAPGTPDPAVRAAVAEELAAAGAGTQARGSLLLEGGGRRLDASVELYRAGAGDWRLKWKTYR